MAWQENPPHCSGHFFAFLPLSISPPNTSAHALLTELLVRGPQEAEWYPVDSAFVDAYRNRIAQVDATDFIAEALRTNLPTFSTPLFLCLPELWQRVEADDLLALLGRMESGMVCFAYVEFVYLYLEVDLLGEALQPAGKRYDVASLKQFFASSQAGRLFVRADALHDLLSGPEAPYLRFDPVEWRNATQRLLRDQRLKPAQTGQQGAEYLAELMASA
ncbi:hypothetical protein [Hymenobacter perfusus]|uniref:Uncharacterized protein n=1 Tax=Hymenobacter perfusus TaxID=1236770 RepID=A0A3R9MED8_9BACT|nr:hypothetical protein [Hymenobacter perfusus]RSK38429.1 hypothetical protein EI293_21665 [Hymenobacter perfusus]